VKFPPPGPLPGTRQFYLTCWETRLSSWQLLWWDRILMSNQNQIQKRAIYTYRHCLTRSPSENAFVFCASTSGSFLHP
jgi:hypothetical protein